MFFIVKELGSTEISHIGSLTKGLKFENICTL